MIVVVVEHTVEGDVSCELQVYRKTSPVCEELERSALQYCQQNRYEASSSNSGPMLLTRKRTALVVVVVEVAMKEFVVVVLFFLDAVAIDVVLMNSVILEG